MRAIIAGLLITTGEALAHEGHGLVGPHPHGWDYVLIAAAIVAGAVALTRK